MILPIFDVVTQLCFASIALQRKCVTDLNLLVSLDDNMSFWLIFLGQYTWNKEDIFIFTGLDKQKCSA